MAFDVVDQDITQLFKNDDTFFIPRYQRNYVWKEINWSQLIKDVRYCAEVTPGWSHFIGSMVFERKQKSGGLVDIIDGQQRILTLQIVIFAMIYCFRDIKEKTCSPNIASQCNLNIAYLQDLIVNRTLGKTETVKVENGYEEYIELNQYFMELREEELHKYDNLLKQNKKNNSIILEALKFFIKDFAELDFEELVSLTGQFLKTRVVAISSMQEEEVYNIFEILNARGVKLKQVELLKNYLFKYLKPKTLLDTYKTKWGELEKLLEGIDLDDYYLHVFRCWYYKNKLSKERLFDVTKEQLRKENTISLQDFFDFFIECGGYYRSICDARGNLRETEVYEYFKLKKIQQARSIFLALKIQNVKGVLSDLLYEKLLILIRNFFIVFNLDNGASNKIDNDVYIMSNEIYKSDEEFRIEYEVYKFFEKFSTYFTKENILENGLKNIIYSNKSTRKNISSKLLVYLYKPLLMEYEKNKYVHYDFNKFSVEHVLNDDAEEDIRYSLGNLLLCPEEINEIMKNKSYAKKRQYLLSSEIPYLKAFAEKYDNFDERCIESRTSEIVEKLKKLYLLSLDNVNMSYLKLKMYFELKKQLEIAFGKDSRYVKELENRGIDKFTEYIYKNGALPNDDVDRIKKCLKNAG